MARDKIRKCFSMRKMGENVISAHMLEVSLVNGSGKGAPSRKGCAVDCQRTESSNKLRMPLPVSPVSVA